MPTLPQSSSPTQHLRDGYTLNGSISLGGKELRLLYRPMLNHDIRSAAKEAKWLSGTAGKEVIRSAALGQIMACDSELESVIHEGGTPELIPALWRLVTGQDTPPFQSPRWELESALNLYQGTALRILHPEVATRDCGACKIWWYDQTTGRICKRNGKNQRRPEDQELPCELPGGCPKGTPQNQKSLSEYNRLALEHFVRCDAVGLFPSDPLVQRNAAIIRKAMRDAQGKLSGRLRPGQAAG